MKFFMNRFSLLVAILGLSFSTYAQMSKTEYEEGIRAKTGGFNADFKSGKITHEQYLYQIDTLQIEETLAYHMINRQSTAEMLENFFYAHQSYDRLLNKYYQQLLTKLEANDKDLLKQAQREWISYRDKERAFSQLLAQDKYSGGGSIQSLTIADRSLELTKKRVNELANYLLYRLN